MEKDPGLNYPEPLDPYAWGLEVPDTDEQDAIWDALIGPDEDYEFESASARLDFWVDDVARQKVAELFGGEANLTEVEDRLANAPDTDAQKEIIAQLTQQEKAGMFDLLVRRRKEVQREDTYIIGSIGGRQPRELQSHRDQERGE